MKVGFAGAGTMAGAIARGWAAGEGGPAEVRFCDLDRGRAEALAADTGGSVIGGLADLAAASDVVLLAVKPGALGDVAEEMGGQAPALLSVMAATPTQRLAEAFPGVPALRVMPNQPVEVRRGVLCWVAGEGLPDELRDRLVGLIGVLGTTVEVPEDRMNAAMALVSCSPAYVALFAEALAAAGAEEGFDPAESLGLVAETLAGTAALLRERDPAAIRSAVAPPRGATEAGLNALDEGGFSEALAAAMNASLERFR
jgi:pyrroline-5-carboxylate reductase